MTWKVMNVTEGTMRTILDWLNEDFKGNIFYPDLKEQGENEFQFMIRTIRQDHPTSTPGYMLTRPEVFGNHAPIPSACWHVRKAFFEALPDEAVLIMGNKTLYREKDEFPDWTVKDWLISNLCHCKGTRREYRMRKRAPSRKSTPRIKGMKGRRY